MPLNTATQEIKAEGSNPTRAKLVRPNLKKQNAIQKG
jgi:hypothetical protein